MTALSYFFSIPSVIYLGISLVIISLLGIFFMQKISQQNHKITSMMGLVTTMAEELNFMRGRFRQVSQTMPSQQQQQVLEKRIVVSDDEESEEDEDDEDDDEDDIDEDSDSDDEEDDDDEPITIDISESTTNNIKVINMSEKFDIHYENLNDTTLQEVNDDDLSDGEDEEDTELEIGDLEVIGEEEATHESVTVEKDNIELLKTINIQTTLVADIQDYKKMPLGKLRNIVTEKGLAQDASKLNKNKLLNLLGFE